MKKLYYLFILSLAFHLTTNAQAWRMIAHETDAYSGGSTISDSTRITYNSDGTVKDSTWYHYNAGTWEPTRKYSHTYTNGLLTQTLVITITTNSHENLSRDTYTYDVNNRLATDITEDWVNNAWKNYNRTAYTYNNKGQVTSIIQQDFSSGNAWENSILTENEYNAHDSLTRYNYTLWDGATWAPYVRYTNIYDQQSNLSQRIYENPVAGVYDTTSLYDFTYDAQRRLTLADRNRKVSLGVYNKESRTGFQYDPATGKRSIETYQEWTGTQYSPLQRDTYAYDADSNNTSHLVEEYGFQWGFKRRELMQYDSHHNMVQLVAADWDTIGADHWSDNSLNKFYYEEYTPTGIAQIFDGGELSIYPNPVANQLTIRTESMSITNGQLMIFSVTGAQVADYHITVSNGPVQVPVTNLGSGIYFIQLTAGNIVYHGKVVKQ